MIGLRASWQVRGGMFPGCDLQPELTRTWQYTSDDYERDILATQGEPPGPHPEKPPTIFETYRKEAVAYWETLNDPAYHNWAELSFVWY